MLTDTEHFNSPKHFIYGFFKGKDNPTAFQRFRFAVVVFGPDDGNTSLGKTSSITFSNSNPFIFSTKTDTNADETLYALLLV
jgi:hypothetical protein